MIFEDGRKVWFCESCGETIASASVEMGNECAFGLHEGPVRVRLVGERCRRDGCLCYPYAYAGCPCQCHDRTALMSRRDEDHA